MALMFVGEAGNFLAYAYAPATLVAPLGAVSVISNRSLSPAQCARASTFI
jgi:hypothetical protein